MSGTRYGISTTEITWEKEESEIERSNKGMVTISVSGCVGVSDTPTPLDDALDLIPSEIFIDNNGPIGNAIKYTGALRVSDSARYLGDDTIQVKATYEIASPDDPTISGDDNLSDSDRVSRSVVTEDAPLLSHPVVAEFSVDDRRKLNSLLNGDTRANGLYKESGTGRELWKFVTEDIKDAQNTDIKEVVFSDTDATADGVTASPLDYALLIAAGITTYRRPSIRHTVSKTRNDPATNAEYSKVGETTTGDPYLAPVLTGGQWFVTGITDVSENGKSWNTNYDFEYTGQGGAYKAIYKGGTKEIT